MAMNEILGYLLSYGVPLTGVILVLVAIIVAMGLAASWSRYIVLGIVVIMLIIPQASSYGTLDGNNAASSIFWVKGTKTFFFSFLDMALFGTWLFGAVIASRLSNQPAQYNASPLSAWYIAFGILFFGQVTMAFFGKSPLILEFATMGVINVLKQGMFVALLFTTIRTERDLKLLTLIIVICIAGRDAWGLFRYVFLGGDPQNIYANTWDELKGLKLTFFDINDHILASLMFGLSTWKLLVDRPEKPYHLIYSALALMAALIPVFSVRRTAQVGFLLAMVILFLLLPRGRKSPVLIALILIIPLSVFSLSLRTVDQSKTLTEKLLIDVKTDGDSDPRKSRLYELTTALETVKEEPFFGVGPSGQFKVKSPIGLEYHNGNYGFVHSGFGHILLKTGFVGLFIFLGLFAIYVREVKKGWKFILPEYKAIVIGCLCGFVAQMPNMFGGAPIVEIRTMLVSGLLFAIPLICFNLSKQKKLENNNLSKPIKTSSFAFAKDKTIKTRAIN
jgi:O-antigen ligase